MSHTEKSLRESREILTDDSTITVELFSNHGDFYTVKISVQGFDRNNYPTDFFTAKRKSFRGGLWGTDNYCGDRAEKYFEKLVAESLLLESTELD